MRTIPTDISERNMLRSMAKAFVENKNIVPPVALHTLSSLSSEFMAAYSMPQEWNDWIMVELHNQVWLPVISAIPFDRRLLLLPKCLSNSSKCQGEIDELGLLCHRCGKCVIPSLQDKADELGVLCMVAEGFTSVIELIENQVVDAVVGVSCLDSLEKAFPLLVNHAVPGIAIPLNKNGCRDTEVDVDYVMSLLPQHARKEISLMNYDNLRKEVNGWFNRDSLSTFCLINDDETSRISFHWLSNNGKRWRPFLLAAVYRALNGDSDFPLEVKNAAVAVECFHKASLVHDDVQDKDLERYGEPTINALYGDAMAINVGDMLVGEGYRLLASCQHKELVAEIANAHISLCRGQGTELCWTRDTDRLKLNDVLEIFRYKTVPAFEVALVCGLICADCGGSNLREILKAYSTAMGVAYQLNDDIEDWKADNVEFHRPSAILALQQEHQEWSREQVLDEVKRLAEDYHLQALNTLGYVENLELKRLLFQVTETILKRKKV